MAESKMGAMVRFCGHNGSFIADVHKVGNCNVVRANGPVTPDNLDRESTPTHHISDFPNAGYWNSRLGVFVVPEKQVRTL
jgi:hypothetical protein